MDFSFGFIFGLTLLERSPPRLFPLDRFHFVQRFVRWHGNVNRLAPPPFGARLTHICCAIGQNVEHDAFSFVDFNPPRHVPFLSDSVYSYRV